MPQKIYFGSVVVQDSRTGKRSTIDRKIYKELEDIAKNDFRNYVLKHINQSERQHFKIVCLCFDTAKVTGETVY